MTQPAQTHRALVTGATGYLGSHLAERLVRDGWHVDAVVRPTSSLRALDGVIETFRIHRHDGTTEQLAEIVSSSAPDIVFHLAAYYRAEHVPAEIVPMLQSNVLFPTQLAQAMATNRVSRLINIATGWQHYGGAAYSPVNLYAATKQAFEDILQYYVEAQDLRVITLTLFETYGPDDPRTKLLRALAIAHRIEAPLEMSPGEQQIDLLHIDDAIEGILVAARRLLDNSVDGHERYVLSGGSPLSVRDVVALVQHATGLAIPVKWGTRSYRQRERFSPWRDGKALPGWRPKIELARGIGDAFKAIVQSITTRQS